MEDPLTSSFFSHPLVQDILKYAFEAFAKAIPAVNIPDVNVKNKNLNESCIKEVLACANYHHYTFTYHLVLKTGFGKVILQIFYCHCFSLSNF